MTYIPEIPQLTASDFDYSTVLNSGSKSNMTAGTWETVNTWIVPAGYDNTVVLVRILLNAGSDGTTVHSRIKLNTVQCTPQHTFGPVDQYVRGRSVYDYITVSEGDAVLVEGNGLINGGVSYNIYGE